MKHYIILILLLFASLFDCKAKQTAIELQEKQYKLVEIERAKYEDYRCIILVKVILDLPVNIDSNDSNSYVTEYKCTYYDKSDNKFFSISLEDFDNFDNETHIYAHNEITDDIYPIFEVDVRGSSDYRISTFFRISKDTLVKLFEIDNNHSKSLRRYDNHTLTGTCTERDELVSEFWTVRYRVSLEDFRVSYEPIIIKNYNYKTEATESFYGYTLTRYNKQNKLKIKKGTKLYLMDYDRDNNLVKIRIKNKFIFVPSENIRWKLLGNGAG